MPLSRDAMRSRKPMKLVRAGWLSALKQRSSNSKAVSNKSLSPRFLMRSTRQSWSRRSTMFVLATRLPVSQKSGMSLTEMVFVLPLSSKKMPMQIWSWTTCSSIQTCRSTITSIWWQLITTHHVKWGLYRFSLATLLTVGISLSLARALIRKRQNDGSTS